MRQCGRSLSNHSLTARHSTADKCRALRDENAYYGPARLPCDFRKHGHDTRCPVSAQIQAACHRAFGSITGDAGLALGAPRLSVDDGDDDQRGCRSPTGRHGDERESFVRAWAGMQRDISRRKDEAGLPRTKCPNGRFREGAAGT